jgi:hypothetical protein
MASAGIYLTGANGSTVNGNATIGTASSDSSSNDLSGTYTYNVDVTGTDTITLTGDWSGQPSTAANDGPSFADGSYSVVGPSLPAWMTFSLDSATGAMSISFTTADLIANGGLNQNFSLDISGLANFGGTDQDTIEINVTCYGEGTRITTPSGDTTVETLSIGDEVLTAEGRAVPVKWIGRQTVSTRFGPAERLMPVRFSAGSLGDGLPHTDLTVTSDHGMLVDGVICHAGALLNGTTITRVPLREMGETYTVYHIETEAHEIILANGAPAETFIDNVSRRAFDNFAEFDALYGDVPEMDELDYPRAMSARQVPETIRRTLAARCVA